MDGGEELPGIEPADYVGIDKDGSGKGWSGQQEGDEVDICNQEKRMIEAYVTDSYDLTPKGIIDGLHLLDVDYNQVSSLGHFGKRDLPWEE